MEILFCVYELGNFEFIGSLTECRQYIAANEFNGSQFTILEV
jgi:hypothetical protein